MIPQSQSSATATEVPSGGGGSGGRAPAAAAAPSYAAAASPPMASAAAVAATSEQPAVPQPRGAPPLPREMQSLSYAQMAGASASARAPPTDRSPQSAQQLTEQSTGLTHEKGQGAAPTDGRPTSVLLRPPLPPQQPFSHLNVRL